MTAVLLLALALAAPAASPPPAVAGSKDRPSGSPWIVVQADGARVAFDSRPESRGGLLVGRLAGSGTLVSIPAARVDAEATARANAPEAAAAPPAASPAPRTQRPFETPPLGDRVRMKSSGEDARRVLEGARTGTPAPAPRTGAQPTVVPDQEETTPTDLLGRGEGYWRERAGEARGVLEAAEGALAAAEAELRAAERSYLGVGEGERNSFVNRIVEARDAAEKARTGHRLALGRWEALQEEARKAGAFPGWLR